MMTSRTVYHSCIFSLLLLSIPVRSSLAVTPQGQIPDQDVLIIGVLDLNPNNVNANETAAVTDRLRMHLGRQSVFQVIERQRLTDMMDEMGFQVSGLCNSDECIVEVGKILGVSKMVAGSVSRVGRLFSLQVRIIDIETSSIDHYALRDVSGIEELFTKATLEVAQELAQKISSQVRPTVSTRSVQPVVLTTGELQVRSDPDGAEILVNNSRFGPAPLTLSLAVGRHELILVSHEYVAYIDTIDIRGGETRAINAALIPVPTGLLEIEAQVTGASVFVDNKGKGITPLAEPLRLPQGYHNVELQLDGAPLEKKQVFVADTTSTVVFEAVAPSQRAQPVTPTTGQIQVLTEPEGAEILIDNVQYGLTPGRLSLKAGTHELILISNEYLAHIDTIDIVGGEIRTINAVLIPVPTGLLEIQTQVTGASIFVDNKGRGITPLAEPLRLPQGYHIVELKMNGTPLEAKQVIITGTPSTVVFESVTPPQPVVPTTSTTGDIRVVTEPEGVEILVDNVQIGTTPSTISLTAGKHELVLVSQDHITHIDSIEVVAGESRTLQVELIPIPTGMLEIHSRTMGATVIVDRQEKGEIPLIYALTLKQGYHVVELRKAGYKSETREVFIQGGSTLTLSVDLTILPFLY